MLAKSVSLQFAFINSLQIVLLSRPDIFKQVEMIDSDMPLMRKESIILLILEVVMERKSKKVIILIREYLI